MKIWLDDLRDPETFGTGLTMANRALRVLKKHGRDGWTWVKTVEDAQALLGVDGVEVLSCDNDLGVGLTEGYKLLDWLEEQAMTQPDFLIPNYVYVHSDDMAKVDSMQVTINNIYNAKAK